MKSEQKCTLNKVWEAVLYRYKPLALIGKGGYGEIIKAYDTV